MPACTQCAAGFEITDADRALLRSLNAPEPKKCWPCRSQQRLAFRNERNLYHRACDLSGAKIVTNYASNSPFKVFSHDAWWGDRWDATEYGRDFDFNRPFFDQFYELQKAVPRLELIDAANENCKYINYAGFSKNCYLLFGSVHCQDCCYGSPYHSRDCVDTDRVINSELAYECLDSRRIYNGVFLQDCSNCSDCAFGFDLQGCKNCFGCVGLRQKQFYIFNQPYSKEDYEKMVSQFNLKERGHFNAARQKFEALRLSTPHQASIILKSQDCVGHHIYESKNVYYGFYAERAEDCRYVNYIIDVKNCMDQEYGEELQFSYGTMGGYRNNSLMLCLPNVESYNLTYSDQNYSCNDLFGCVGLRRKKYCVFNKPYGKEEYETLRQKIIGHMKKTGEWGDFFPVKYSLFAYNESVAHDEYYPLKKEECIARGWRWRDAPADKPTQNVEFDETVHTCAECDKRFRCIPTEVALYKKMGLPEPDKCFLCRYHDRIGRRNPRLLFDRACAKCSAPVRTSYSPDRPEIVYCEACYLKEVY